MVAIVAHHLARTTRSASTPAVPSVVAPATSPAAAIERADAAFTRDGSTLCAGGTLVVLPDFASVDGKFDLVVHFHGASDLVGQSFGAAKLNAVVVVFNVGISSGSYRDRFTYAPMFTAVLDHARSLMQQRHLRDASVRRVALSAFSAGFGAVERVLQNPGVLDSIDAVLLLDGIHTSYDEKRKLDLRPIEPFLTFARAAAKNDKLFFITHSEIPTFEYGSTHATTDLLLDDLGLERQAGGDVPAMPDLPAMGYAVAREKLRPLEPLSHAETGGFFVRGYAGAKPENHLSHLLQMASTAAPALAARWREK